MSFLMKLLSYPYQMVISIRHWMFNCGLLKSEKFNTPVICVGNITVGGTGKTPTAEMIVDEFLNAEYEGGRHQTRIDMISAIEQGEM